MSPTGGLALAFLLGSLLSPGRLGQAIEKGFRDYLGVPPETALVVQLAACPDGGLVSGSRLSVTLAGQELDGLGRVQRRSAAARPSPPPGEEAADAQRPAARLCAVMNEVAINMPGATLHGIAVPSAAMGLRDVTYDLGRLLTDSEFQLLAVGQTDASLQIDLRSLAAWVQAQAERVENVVLKADTEGHLELTGQVDLELFHPRIRARGKLVVQEGRAVSVVEPKLEVGSLAIPRRIMESVVKALNPVVSLDPRTTVGRAFSIDEVSGDDQVLMVTGHLRAEELIYSGE